MRISANMSPMRLLVVEDDPGIAGPLGTGLRREGFEVELARTGAEALASGEVDLVLLDLGLPDMDGKDVCRKLRERSGVPVIVVTARGDELDLEALATEAGTERPGDAGVIFNDEQTHGGHVGGNPHRCQT